MQASEYILGDRCLHQRLLLTTAILGKFVLREKAKYTSDYLAQELGCSTALVHALCSTLNRYGFVSKSCRDEDGEEWSLVCDSAFLSLGDVFIAVAESSQVFEDELIQTIENSERSREAELLVSQAAMDVNALVHRHLKQFCLLSLKTHADRRFRAAEVRAFI